MNLGKNQIKAICLVFWLAALLFIALSGLLGWNLAQVGREDLTSVGGRVVTVQRAGDLYRLELEEFPGRAFTLSDYCCQADLTEALTAGEEVVLEVSRAQLEGGAAEISFYSLTRAGESLVPAEEVLAARRTDGILSVSVVGFFGLVFLVAALAVTVWSRRCAQVEPVGSDACIAAQGRSFYALYLGKDLAFQRKRKHFLLSSLLSLGGGFVLYMIAVPVLAGVLGDLDPLFIGLTIGGAVLLLLGAALFMIGYVRFWKKNAGLFAAALRDHLEQGPEKELAPGQPAAGVAVPDLAGFREVRFEEGEAVVRLPDLGLGDMAEAEDLLPGLPSGENPVFPGFEEEGEPGFLSGREIFVPLQELHLFVRCRYFNGEIPVAVFVCYRQEGKFLESELVLELTHDLYQKLKEKGVEVQGLDELFKTLGSRIARLSPQAMFGTILD